MAGHPIDEIFDDIVGSCGDQDDAYTSLKKFRDAVKAGWPKIRSISNYSRKTPVRDRYGNLWFLELTSGAWGQISVQVTKKCRGYNLARGDRFMPLLEFFEWARKRRLKGLGYEELFGPNAPQYGRSQYYGNQK